MAYSKPGITVEQVISTAVAAARTPLLRAAVIGDVYQVEKQVEAAADYDGTAASLAYPGLKTGATVDQGDGATYPPQVWVQHDGDNYEVTNITGVSVDENSVDLPANLEYVVVKTQTDGAFSNPNGGNYNTFVSSKGNFLGNAVRAGDHVKVGSDLHEIKAVDSSRQLSLRVGPAAAATAQTYTIVRRLEGEVLISYRAARADAAVVSKYLEVDSITELEDLFGEDAVGSDENPLGFAMSLALSASGTVVAGAGTNAEATSSSASWQKALEALERPGVYNIAALTMDTTLQDLVISHVNALSQPERRRERRCYIAREIPETLERDGDGGSRGYVLVDSNILRDGDGSFVTDGVEAGDVIEIDGETYDVAVTPTSETELQVAQDLDFTPNVTTVSTAVGTGDTAIPLTAATGFIAGGGSAIVYDATNGLQEIAYSAVSSGSLTITAGSVIASGAHIAPVLAANELAYGVAEREYSKDEMARNAGAVSRGLANERVTLIGPDKFTFSINGEDEELDAFYAAAIAAGQRSGARVGQPLTNTALPGPTTVNKGSDYFSELQLDEIAGEGWKLFVQDALSAPLYCRDDLTTRQGEGARYSTESDVVARDYAAYTLRRTMRNAVGRTRITPRTIQNVALTINGVINELLSEPFQPFLSLTLSSLEISASNEKKLTAVINATQSSEYSGTDITLVV